MVIQPVMFDRVCYLCPFDFKRKLGIRMESCMNEFSFSFGGLKNKWIQSMKL